MPPTIPSSISASNALPARRARPRLRDVLLPGVFLLALALVLLCTDWSGRGSRVAELEERLPAPWPAAPRSLGELASYPRRFGAFFADHFGLRAEMVALRGWIGLGGLGKSSSPLVIVGTHGWLFFAGNQSIENHLHRLPLSAAELDRWAERLQERKRWFSAHGITYLFVVAPDKQSIYPEYLPPSLIAREGQTRLDQLDARLAGNAAWLDLRPAMLAAKPEGLLYFRGDTHWNDFGAYLAHRAIMRHLGLPAVPRNPARLVPIRHPVDLARMSGVPRTEPNMYYRPGCAKSQPSAFDARAFVSDDPTPAYNLPATVCATARGRLLMFQDSFSGPLSPYLSESFARAVYVWREPTLAQMRAIAAVEHPSVVIEQRAERFLIAPLAP